MATDIDNINTIKSAEWVERLSEKDPKQLRHDLGLVIKNALQNFGYQVLFYANPPRNTGETAPVLVVNAFAEIWTELEPYLPPIIEGGD